MNETNTAHLFIPDHPMRPEKIASRALATLIAVVLEVVGAKLIVCEDCART
jgi:hypothetical protein